MPAGAGRKGGEIPRKKCHYQVPTDENRIPLQVSQVVNSGKQCSSTNNCVPGLPIEGNPDCVPTNTSIN